MFPLKQCIIIFQSIYLWHQLYAFLCSKWSTFLINQLFCNIYLEWWTTSESICKEVCKMSMHIRKENEWQICPSGSTCTLVWRNFLVTVNGWFKACDSFGTLTIYVITTQNSLTLWASKIVTIVRLCLFLCYRNLNVGVISFPRILRTDHELSLYLCWPELYVSH